MNYVYHQYSVIEYGWQGLKVEQTKYALQFGLCF